MYIERLGGYDKVMIRCGKTGESIEESIEGVPFYKFDFCVKCPFYKCELVEEYARFRENHINESQIQDSVPIANYELESESMQCRISYYIETQSSDIEVLSYDKCQSKLEDNYNCIMSDQYVYQVECGQKNVTEGIGDHYKIEIDHNGNIKKYTVNKWEPMQPVFISAQTGQGKNYFVENTLVPYVKELNYIAQRNQKVLILSNRLALKQQIMNRIKGNDDKDDEKIYPYKECVDVMTYQSLLKHAEYLEDYQKNIDSRYIYVICDEAHFFTSDAMFNPHTHIILQKLVELFQDAIRVYMSATPYDCLEYIIKCEKEYQKSEDKTNGHQSERQERSKMVLYHFKRDYSYLDIKMYSSIKELYDEIVESVIKRNEKWLIFIDDREKCASVKGALEKLANDKQYPFVNKDDQLMKKTEKIFAVDADSKRNPIYQVILDREMLNKDTYVLISTSVLDNGVNLTGIKNIVVSDMSKVKCLQMVGRARKGNNDEHKTVYIKKFGINEVEKRKEDLEKQKEAYHKYELVYGKESRDIGDYTEYDFLNEYYNGKESDWQGAKRWFGRNYDKPTNLYLNEIAKSLVERLIPQYQYILDEMKEEEAKKDEYRQDQEKGQTGQKYLEYQLSWFGKRYCVDDDITFADKEKAKKEFINFLELYVKNGEQIVDTGEESQFRKKFTKLCDAALGRKEPNLKRIYHISKMNKLLKENHIDYKVDSKSSYWLVIEHKWGSEKFQ